MTAALSEIAVGFPRNSSLYLGHRLDDYLRLLDEVVEAATGDRIAGSVDDGRGFDEISWLTDAGRRCSRLLVRKALFRLVAQDGDQRRGIDDHRGSPRIVIEIVAVIGGSPRLLEARRAVLAHCKKAVGKRAALFSANAVEPLPHGDGDCSRSCSRRSTRRAPRPIDVLLVLYVEAHLITYLPLSWFLSTKFT